MTPPPFPVRPGRLPAQEGLDALEAPDTGHDHEDPAADGVVDRIRGRDTGQDAGLVGGGHGSMSRQGSQDRRRSEYTDQLTVYFTKHVTPPKMFVCIALFRRLASAKQRLDPAEPPLTSETD